MISRELHSCLTLIFEIIQIHDLPEKIKKVESFTTF